MGNINLIGQQFGNRLVLNNKCEVSDWLSIGKKVPTDVTKYVLTQCLNCGHIFPTMLRNLKAGPKKCVYCSNIGNFSHIHTDTNTWALYDEYSVCNVQNNNNVISFYIDTDDYQLVQQYTWRISRKRQKYYVVTGSSKKGTMVYLHRLVIGCDDPSLEVDHIDGNSLNNRKRNLRIVSRLENIDNQRATRIDNAIGIRGISYSKKSKSYLVDFYYHNNRFHFKSWPNIEEAVWCRYCLEDYFGLSAIKNNPLAEQYYTLTNEKKEEIHKYVLGIISQK